VHGGHENLVSAVIAIVDYLHGPHRLASEELASSGLIGTKNARGLIESHPTDGTGYLSNTLWTNSILIHHPEENEFFAAIRAPGDKLVRKALSHAGLSALYSMASSMGSPSLSYDGDHCAAYPLIILFALEMQTIPSTQCLNSRPGRCLQFRKQQVRMSFVARRAAKGGGWGAPLAGAVLSSCKFTELNPRAGPSRGTWSSWCWQKDRIFARKVRDEGEAFFCSDLRASSRFLTPLFVN